LHASLAGSSGTIIIALVVARKPRIFDLRSG
jgi:hypothetical protein